MQLEASTDVGQRTERIRPGDMRWGRLATARWGAEGSSGDATRATCQREGPLGSYEMLQRAFSAATSRASPNNVEYADPSRQWRSAARQCACWTHQRCTG